MDATTVISQIFTGTVSGMMLVLMALGLTLIFGVMNVVNFAHGALYMVGAYFLFFTLQKVGNFWVALALVPVLVGAVGILIERILMRPLYGRPEEDPILMTFGLTYIFMEGMRMYFGKIGLAVDAPASLSSAVNLGLFYFPSYMIFSVVCAMLAIFGLWVFQEKTDVGLIVRAGSRDSVMVRVLGLDFNRVRLLSFSIGTALAGPRRRLVRPDTRGHSRNGSAGPSAGVRRGRRRWKGEFLGDRRQRPPRRSHHRGDEPVVSQLGRSGRVLPHGGRSPGAPDGAVRP